MKAPSRSSRQKAARTTLPLSDEAQRSRAAARNSRVRGAHRVKDRPLLDPHGIYGTRTAARMRAARRRQALQRLFAALLLSGLCVFAFLRWKAPRVGSLRLDDSVAFGGTLSSVSTAGNQFWTVSRSGIIRHYQADTDAWERVGQVGMPSLAPPLVTSRGLLTLGEDGIVQLLNMRTGQALWKRSQDATFSVRAVAVKIPQAAGKPADAAVAIDDNGVAVAYHIQTGKPLWRTSFQCAPGEGARAIGSKLWVPLGGGVGTRGGLSVLDLPTGRLLQRLDFGAAHLAPVARGDAPQNRTLLVSTGDEGALYCYDSATMKRRWKVFLQPTPGSSFKDALVLRGEPLFKTYSWGTNVFVGASDGTLRALNANNGNELWAFDAGSCIEQRPVSLRLGKGSAQRDLVLVANRDGDIYAVEAKTGRQVWRIRGNSSSLALAIRDGKLWNFRQDGVVERYELPE